MTEYEIYNYEAFKKRINDELRTVDRATMDNLSKNNVAEYLKMLRRQKPNLVNLKDGRLLETQEICQGEFPTVAGLMLLAAYPQEFFPQLSVTAMVVQGKAIRELGDDGERFIDNKRIEGTIHQMLEGTLAFARRNMRMKSIIAEYGSRADKPEYPIKALREIILNALIHRDYSVHTERPPIRLVLYEDRLELENPGSLYGRITVDNLGKVPADTRNPYMAGALEIMIGTENRFSGIPTILTELKKAGMPAPVFINERGAFKVMFYKKGVNENNLTQKQLADKLSVSQAMVSKLESGEYNPTVELLFKISKKLDWKFGVVLEESEMTQIWNIDCEIISFHNKDERIISCEGKTEEVA
ncbi:MAG: ATP-binding protein [Alkaliphilus sp.]